MDVFMQWATESDGAAPEAFPSLQALQSQSTAVSGGVGVRDLTVQVDQHLATSSWSTSSGAGIMEQDPTAIAAGWSPHTADSSSSRPVSWNSSDALALRTDASLVSPAAATAATGWRSGVLLAASTAAHGQAGGGGGGGNSDHIMAERRRRENINQRFVELSAVIPGLKRMDKATILGNAVKYVKEIQEKVKKLEDGECAAAAVATTTNTTIKPCLGLDGEASTGGLPEIGVRVWERKSVLVRIQCENVRGILVRVLAEVEALRLAITHTSVMPFPPTTAIITITAKVEEGFNSTVEQIVNRLNSALTQHYSTNSDHRDELILVTSGSDDEYA